MADGSAEKRVVMVVIQNFTTGGKQYTTGSEVTPEDVKDWPEGALERRVANKFVTSKIVQTAAQRVAEDAASLDAAAAKLRSDGSKSAKKE